MSEIQGFDAGLHRARGLRKIRRQMILLALLACFVEFQGTPHLRMNTAGIRARYWGVSGTYELHSDAAPLIVLRPLERSLLAFGGER